MRLLKGRDKTISRRLTAINMDRNEFHSIRVYQRSSAAGIALAL
jgi:hypothetical protein